MAGIEKFTGGVVGFLKRTRIGATVHMDIENGEKDAHSAKLSLTETRILCFVDADDFTVRRTDQSQGVGRRGSFGVPKEEQQADKKQEGKGSGNPPSQPKGGS